MFVHTIIISNLHESMSLLCLLLVGIAVVAAASNVGGCGIADALRHSVTNGIPESELMTLDTSVRDDASRRKRQTAQPIRIKPDWTYFNTGLVFCFCFFVIGSLVFIINTTFSAPRRLQVEETTVEQ